VLYVQTQLEFPGCISHLPVLIWPVLAIAGVLCYFRTDEDCQHALDSEELAATPEQGNDAEDWLSSCLQINVRDGMCRRIDFCKFGERLHSVGEHRSNAYGLLR